MKKIVCLILVCILLISLSSCINKNNTQETSSDKTQTSNTKETDITKGYNDETNASRISGTEESVENGKSVDTVEYLISFENNAGISSAILVLDYNTELLLLNNVEFIGEYADGAEEPNIRSASVKLLWCDLVTCTQTDFAKLTFKVVSENIVLAQDDVRVYYEEGNVCDINENDIFVSIRCERIKL